MALDYDLADYPLCEKWVEIAFSSEPVKSPTMLTVGAARFSGTTVAGLEVEPFNGVVIALEQKDGGHLSYDFTPDQARRVAAVLVRMADAVDGGWKP